MAMHSFDDGVGDVMDGGGNDDDENFLVAQSLDDLFDALKRAEQKTSGWMAVDDLLETCKAIARAQELASFTKEHLPPAHEGWAMD
eukprot:5672094-Pyramimonas_sp.AAC.1